MKTKTYLILILLILILTSLMTGCKKTVEEKVTEKIIENATGGDVDIKNNTTTITTDEGSTQIGTNIKWPKEKVGSLKEIKANITMMSISEEDEMVFITYDDLKKDDAEKYLESLKELGYESLFENISQNGFIFNGSAEDGSQVTFDYYIEGTGSLSYAPKSIDYLDGYDSFGDDSVSLDDPSSSEEIDMTDDVPWPGDFFKELPEPEGKITGISSSGDSEKYIYIEYVEKEIATDYIDKIKAAGFTESPTESMSGDYIEYQASNPNEDYIIFSWNSGNYASLTMVKSE